MPPPENGVDGSAPAPATTALQQTTDAAAARLLVALCRASTVAAASRPKTTPASLLTAPPKRAIKGLEADEQRVSLALQLLATTLSGRRWLGRRYAGRPALLWEFETSTGGRMIDAAVNLARDCVRINASACRILDALRRYHAALQRPLAAPPAAPAPAVAVVAAAPTVTLVPAPAAAPAADGAVPMEEAPPAAGADAPPADAPVDDAAPAVAADAAAVVEGGAEALPSPFPPTDPSPGARMSVTPPDLSPRRC